MMNFKALFSTPKKAAAIIVCLLAIAAAVGIGIAYVAGGNAGSTDSTDVIGAENAQNFAFADAGVDPVSAQAVRVTYERFEGEFVYSVEFIAGGTEYAYKINAQDGSVLRKESRRLAEPDGGGTGQYNHSLSGHHPGGGTGDRAGGCRRKPGGGHIFQSGDGELGRPVCLQLPILRGEYGV